MGVADWIVSVLAVIAVPVVTILVARSTRRSTEKAAAQTSEQQQISDLRKRVGDTEEQQRMQSDYIFQLREHIADEKPPPPPPWPEGLKR